MLRLSPLLFVVALFLGLAALALAQDPPVPPVPPVKVESYSQMVSESQVEDRSTNGDIPSWRLGSLPTLIVFSSIQDPTSGAELPSPAPLALCLAAALFVRRFL